MSALREVGIITDFHSHILPGLDHGSSSRETSLWQIKAAKKAGVSRIVATSHFYADSIDVPSFLSLRSQCFAELSEALMPDDPEILLGAEVLLFENLDRMPLVEKLCIEGTNVFLAELPMNSIDDSIAGTVERLIDKGLDVILAHADRYETHIINVCIDVGAKIQLNAEGLIEYRNRKRCLRWADDGHVYAIGSDIHGKGKNYELFKKAVKILGDRRHDIFARTDSLLRPENNAVS